MELFRIYYLPQLLIDLYQPHLCLCTDDEPAVFQSDSHDDTAVQPPVSGIILQDATKRIHLEPPVSVGGAAAVIIRDAAGCLSAHTAGDVRADIQRGVVILSQRQPCGHPDGYLQVQLVHPGVPHVVHIIPAAYGYKFQSGSQRPGLIQRVFRAYPRFAGYLRITAGVLSVKAGSSDSRLCIKGDR